MRYLTILISAFTFVLASVAQEDDMYFTVKKTKDSDSKKKTHTVEVIYASEPVTVVTTQVPQTVQTSSTLQQRDVDEYNRRGRGTSSSSSVTMAQDTLQTTQTYELSAQSLYDLGYTEGYEHGYSDAEDVDYYYALRLARFHGGHYYDPWYWNRVTYIYDPWHWDPWYYDPWYRPYYYGGWYSVGWGIGYWGSYWNHYWPGYYPHHHHPYPSYHPHWGPVHPHKPSPGPRVSTSRNRDYGSARIVDRSSHASERTHTDRAPRGNVAPDRGERNRNDRTGNLNGRVNNRSNRVTDRSTPSGNREKRNVEHPARTTERNTVRSNSSTNTVRSNRNEMNRSVNRSSERQSSPRMSGNSSNSSRSGSFGSGGSRSGGSRGGGSRGR